jgi:hypothetical protein
MTGIGAILTCIWIIYHSFGTAGILATLVGIVFLGIFYRLCVVVSTLVCFYFHVVGWWLPVISYVLAGFLLYMDLRLDAAKHKAT